MLQQVSECPFFLRLNSIPSHVQTTFGLSVHLSVDPSVLTKTPAAMNMRVRVLFSNLGSLPGSGVSGSHGNSLLNFLRCCQTVFYHDYDFTVSQAVDEGSNFPISSPKLVLSHLLENRGSKMCKVILHCGFDLHFPDK